MSATPQTVSSLSGGTSSTITTTKIDSLQSSQLPHQVDDIAMELPFQPNEPLPGSNHHQMAAISGIAGPLSASATSTANHLSLIGNANVGGLGGITNATTTANNLNVTLMQSSPPPHSYRHSRAYRHFKNPPQPHMCIRTTTEVGEELFINVLSWTRIVIPQEPSDPIPLYGGMRVPPGSPRSPPIVFAVMANPEVLKDSGRHSKDPEERRAMVELMCDFVEAMNPGVKLVRNAVILKDRDISGELKDVWNAVQAQRDREREEQMMQQRQQQHYHNLTTQQMFPKSSESTIVAGSKQQQGLNTGIPAGTTAQKSENEASPKAKTASQTEATIETATSADSAATAFSTLAQQLDNKAAITTATGAATAAVTSSANGDASAADGGDNKPRIKSAIAKSGLNGDVQAVNSIQVTNATASVEQNVSCDQIDAITKIGNAKDKNEIKNSAGSGGKQQSNISNAKTASNASNSTKDNPQQQQLNVSSKTLATTPTSPTTTPSSNAAASLLNTVANAPAAAATIVTPAPTLAPAPTPTPTPAPTKKEKLGGFLPNGCIFPRFKNNKHKDKDKDSKPKEKEKTLLNALKKSKDKKVAPIDSHSADKNSTAATVDVETKSQYEKNCINLESEVEKLDLNKIDSSTNNENMFIKLKVSSASSAAAAAK